MLPVRFLIFPFTSKSKVLDPPKPYFTFILTTTHSAAFPWNHHKAVIAGIQFWDRDSHYKCSFLPLDLPNFEISSTKLKLLLKVYLLYFHIFSCLQQVPICWKKPQINSSSSFNLFEGTRETPVIWILRFLNRNRYSEGVLQLPNKLFQIPRGLIKPSMMV